MMMIIIIIMVLMLLQIFYCVQSRFYSDKAFFQELLSLPGCVEVDSQKESKRGPKGGNQSYRGKVIQICTAFDLRRIWNREDVYIKPGRPPAGSGYQQPSADLHTH